MQVMRSGKLLAVQRVGPSGRTKTNSLSHEYCFVRTPRIVAGWITKPKGSCSYHFMNVSHTRALKRGLTCFAIALAGLVAVLLLIINIGPRQIMASKAERDLN